MSEPITVVAHFSAKPEKVKEVRRDIESHGEAHAC